MTAFSLKKIGIGLTLSLGMVAGASAQFSANLGLMSEYYFRGIQQSDGAAANAGLDYESGGFYAGTWAADVNDGLEVDGYLGYGIELDSGLSLAAGATTYQYTGDFDSDYNEVNFYAGYGIASVEYSVGSWGGVVGDEAATEDDYTYFSLALEQNGFYALYGSLEFDMADDADDYFEFGYGTTVGDFDVGVALMVSALDADTGGEGEALLFSVSKAFDL